jgi:hypothetical protein
LVGLSTMNFPTILVSIPTTNIPTRFGECTNLNMLLKEKKIN